MQTRNYDDYIYIESTLGFRKVDNSGTEIDITQETDGYCNLYADNVSVSYLHNMNDFQVNAIHYFEKNQDEIFLELYLFLDESYKNLEKELGFKCVNILNENDKSICLTEYTFIDASKNKIKVKMLKNTIKED